MYDVILFSDVVGRGWISKPLGPYRIATELRKHGYTVKVVNYLSEWLNEPNLLFDLLDKLISDKTLFIGFSGVFFGNRDIKSENFTSYEKFRSARFRMTTWPGDTDYVNSLLQNIKNKYSHVKLVYGGVYDASKDRELNQSVDYIVRGFGDKKVIELASHLRYNTPLRTSIFNKKLIDHDIKGLEFDFANSQVLYTEDDDIIPGEILPLETSRGCMFKCSFCEFPLLGRKKSDPDYIKHNELLVQELKNNYENFNVSSYMIVDDTFNETNEKLEALLKVRDSSKVPISFSAYIRADLVCRFPQQISLLKELGIKSAFLGIESLNWQSAKSIGKGIHPDKVKETLSVMKEQWGNDVLLHGNFIVGLPHDTIETLDEWVPWVIDHSPLDNFDFNGLGINYLNGQSELARNYTKFGYTIENNQWKNSYWSWADAQTYARNIMTNAWNSGRLKVSGWDFMGLQNMGYSAEELKTMSLKDVDRVKCDQLAKNTWEAYRIKMIHKYQLVQ